MAKISKYIYNSDLIEGVKSTYLSPDQFKDLYQSLESEFDKRILLRHLIRFNTPYVFKDCPLVFEQVRHYLAQLLHIDVSGILLIGSAKTGFSMSPDTYGRQFSEKSDLDFTIVDSSVFDSLKAEYWEWRTKYTIEKSVFPRSEKEKGYWDNNISGVERTIKRGFIDTRFIPNLECCTNTRNINESMYRMKIRLDDTFNIKISHASSRVYKDLPSFYRQFSLNTDRII